MWTIAFKETSTFFSSLAGFIISGVFLLLMGLMLFFFPDTSILSSNYATMDGLFYLAPTIFTFVIPAITMRFFCLRSYIIIQCINLVHLRAIWIAAELWVHMQDLFFYLLVFWQQVFFQAHCQVIRQQLSSLEHFCASCVNGSFYM